MPANESPPPLVPSMPTRLFLSSGNVLADRRFDFARDLLLRGDAAAAAELLLQAIVLDVANEPRRLS